MNNDIHKKQSPFPILNDLERQWKINYSSTVSNMSKVIINDIKNTIK